MPADSLSPFAELPGRGFATTEWSVVLDAGTDGEGKQRALEKLCRTYWRPVYGFIRRLGHPREEARDLTQAFFAHLLTSGFFASATPSAVASAATSVRAAATSSAMFGRSSRPKNAAPAPLGSRGTN